MTRLEDRPKKEVSQSRATPCVTAVSDETESRGRSRATFLDSPAPPRPPIGDVFVRVGDLLSDRAAALVPDADALVDHPDGYVRGARCFTGRSLPGVGDS